MLAQRRRVTVGAFATAKVAHVRFLDTVHVDVFFSVATVGKSPVAVFEWTQKGFLACGREFENTC